MLSTPKQRIALIFCTALSLNASLAPSTKAQTRDATAHPLEFEASTIKPSAGTGPDTDIYPDGVVKLQGFSLKTMIQMAFNVDYRQIAGGQTWVEQTAYDVTGEPSDAVRQSHPDTRHTRFSIADPRLREMLQSLLIERFHLRIHRTTQTGKLYLLERTTRSLALHPAKIKPAPADSSSPESTLGEIDFTGVSGSGDSQMASWFFFDTTMQELASYASSYVLHRPVLDHTGITGGFDYQSKPESWSDHWADQDGSFKDLLKDLGLKLTPSTGPTEILTIDHADFPSPN
jgi:uncharacterized protein (TIGR03435 family)